MWSRLRRLFRPFTPLPDEEFREQRNSLLAKTPIPTFWLYGKTGSGKTSVVRALTGAEDAAIGNGYRPETQFSSRYAFPSEESPLLAFLDTRGLGEAGYDARADVEEFGEQAHLMLVTLRVSDSATDVLHEPLAELRRENKGRPVVLALTCLHECYPGSQHPAPDPFANAFRLDEQATEWDADAIVERIFSGAPDADEGLRRLKEAVRARVERFAPLVDAVVLIDLTREEDGFLDSQFGIERLRESLLHALPDAYRQTFLRWREVADSLRSLHEAKAHPYILSSATLAATAASVPVPWVDLPIVAGIQLDLVRRLGKVYGQSVDAQEFLTAAGLVGGPLMLRQGLREVLKFLPWVGVPANAALGFATTYGLGRAYCWYYGQRQAGIAPARDEIRQVLREQISIAEQLWAADKEARREASSDADSTSEERPRATSGEA